MIYILVQPFTSLTSELDQPRNLIDLETSLASELD